MFIEIYHIFSISEVVPVRVSVVFLFLIQCLNFIGKFIGKVYLVITSE